MVLKGSLQPQVNASSDHGTNFHVRTFTLGHRDPRSTLEHRCPSTRKTIAWLASVRVGLDFCFGPLFELNTDLPKLEGCRFAFEQPNCLVLPFPLWTPTCNIAICPTIECRLNQIGYPFGFSRAKRPGFLWVSFLGGGIFRLDDVKKPTRLGFHWFCLTALWVKKGGPRGTTPLSTP